MTDPIATRAAPFRAALAALCALSASLLAPAASAAAVDESLSRQVGPWLITHAPGEHACHADLRQPEGALRLDLSHSAEWKASGRLEGAAFAAAAGRPVHAMTGHAVPGAETEAAPAGAGLLLRFAGAEPLSLLLLSGGMAFEQAEGEPLVFATPDGLAVLSELVNCAEAVRPVPAPVPGA